MHADHYYQNGVPYNELAARGGTNWWNIISWYPDEPDASDLHTDSDGIDDLESYYRADSVSTTDENGNTIQSPLDIRNPHPKPKEPYSTTQFDVSIEYGPIGVGYSTISVEDPDVDTTVAPDHDWVEWTLTHSDDNLPSSQNDSNGVNFEAECDLTDPNQNYDPKYGDRDVSVECEAQDSFTYWSTRSGGGTRIEETPIMVMYPSAWVV